MGKGLEGYLLAPLPVPSQPHDPHDGSSTTAGHIPPSSLPCLDRLCLLKQADKVGSLPSMLVLAILSQPKLALARSVSLMQNSEIPSMFSGPSLIQDSRDHPEQPPHLMVS
jgi:hypothetical protein